MPATPDSNALRRAALHGDTTVTAVSDTTQTTIFSAVVPSGQLNTVGACFYFSHFGRITTTSTIGASMDLTFRLKLGSSTLATAIVDASGGNVTTGTILNLVGDFVTVSATTAESHMTALAALPAGGYAASGASNNSAVVTTPEIAGGALTVTLTVQWGADPASVAGVYTGRMTVFSFSS